MSIKRKEETRGGYIVWVDTTKKRYISRLASVMTPTGFVIMLNPFVVQFRWIPTGLI
jgi:hypothetical protein